ncbi:MAG: restriction endonuclease subunit S [Flavobacteriales bacterium]|nr:restriction endonuclease subunit S [Flavobacteriales bacterium]
MELIEAPVSEEVQPGFRRTEVGVFPVDWKIRTLGDECQTITKGTTPTSIGKHFQQYGIRFIKAESLTDDGAVRPEFIAYINEETHRLLRRSQLQSNDVLFSIAGVLGRVAVVPNSIPPANTNQALAIIRLSGDSKLDVGYLTRVLRSAAISTHIFGINVQAAQANLSLKNVSEFPIPTPPSKDEQRAIATALSDADSLLSSLEQLIAKKKAIKQGAMQALLTPPGQPGHKRLPGFKGAWEPQKVEEVIGDYFSGPSPTCEERNVRGDEWGVLKTTATTWEYGWDWRAHKTLPRSFWGRSHIELRAGDVIVTKAGPRSRVGVSSWIDFVPPRIIPSGKMIALRPNQDKVMPFMLSSAIAARPAQVFLDQRTTGMAESQMNYENAALLQCPLLLPPVKEQVAIGEVITDMANEVRALEEKLEKLRNVKQGMMQELLTGRKRLV